MKARFKDGNLKMFVDEDRMSTSNKIMSDEYDLWVDNYSYAISILRKGFVSHISIGYYFQKKSSEGSCLDVARWIAYAASK